MAMQNPSESSLGVYTYTADWPIYTLAWSVCQHKSYRLAIGSFLEDYSNKVEVVEFNLETSDFMSDKRLIFDHPYAPTNIMFNPSKFNSGPDLIATSGDYLRIWEIHDDHIKLKSLLNGNKRSEFHGGISSFDWAHFDFARVVTASVDTTSTIWNIETQVIDTQLVAHDKQVYDVSWGGFNIFSSVSEDGSVRVFDLRDKKRSTIIYENPFPLLRVEWNKTDSKYIGVIGMDSNKIVILDIRYPTNPLMELCKHKGSVNAISWSPLIGQNICSVGDDSRVFIWDTNQNNSSLELKHDIQPSMWYESMAGIIMHDGLLSKSNALVLHS